MARALGYPRVSTDEQAEKGYSLPEQEGKIRAYCIAHSLTLMEMVTDDFTGKILDRPGLRRVTELAEAGAFDVLVCVKLDRLARANYLRRLYEERLAALGITVQFVEQRFDETSSGRLQKGVMGEFAEYESEVIRERTMGGRLEKATRRGTMPCNAATYGYHQITSAEAAVIHDYANRSGEFMVAEAEAAIVRRIFEAYAGGKSIRAIAAILNDEGTPTRTGKLWRPCTVRVILLNEAYVGRLYFGRREFRSTSELTPAGNVRVRCRLRPRSEWVEIGCPPIISEALFAAAQQQLEENRRRLTGRPTRIWLLHGSVVCGVCRRQRDGKPRTCQGSVNYRRGRTYRRYICSSTRGRDPDGGCGTTFIADRLETMARDALRRAAEPGRLAEFARGEAEERLRQTGDPKADLGRLEEELRRLDQQEETLLDSVLAGGFDARIVQGKREKIHARRDQAHREIAMVRTRLANTTMPEEAAKRGEAAAERLRQGLAEAENDPKLLQELFRLFLEVRIYRDREPEIQVRVPVLS
jgi:site-specific DNA recombinase